MHTALLHDQTINERLGYNLQGYLESARLRSRIEIPSLMAEPTTSSSLGSSSLLWNCPSFATRPQSSRPGWQHVLGKEKLYGSKRVFHPSILLLTRNPGYPQWSLHHTDLV